MWTVLDSGAAELNRCSTHQQAITLTTQAFTLLSDSTCPWCIDCILQHTSMTFLLNRCLRVKYEEKSEPLICRVALALFSLQLPRLGSWTCLN